MDIEDRYRYERDRYAWSADCYLWQRRWPEVLSEWGKRGDGLLPYFRFWWNNYLEQR